MPKLATLGAIAPNQAGPDGILTRAGKYAVTGGGRLEAARIGADGHFPRGDLHMGVATKAEKLRTPGGAGGPNSAWLGQADESAGTGTSIFDPVLCELAYRWFCPPGGHVFDPFAGGSVRGIVAATLGRRYIGIDLRPEQAAANEVQAARICPDNAPIWVVGDALDCLDLAPGEYDFLWSCPPYFDLEVYSDDPRDLSTLSWEGFLEGYYTIIERSLSMLKENSFAAFVVGDVRDKKTGLYRNFPGETIKAFEACGARLYNDAALVTAVGSLPIRVGRQFSASRKLGTTHQRVLVFVKGDPRAAADAVGPVEVGDLAEWGADADA